MSQYKSWGTKWDPSMTRGGGDYGCPECAWKPESGKKWVDYGIGFDTDGPLSKHSKSEGVLIIECPQDFTKFYLHLNKDSVEYCRELYPDKFKLSMPESEINKGKRK